jgi:hypothetical protein
MEDYLSAPRGDDAVAVGTMHAELDRWKTKAGQPAHACRLVSAEAASVEIPFIKMTGWAGHTRGFGVEAGLNAANVRLDLAGGEGGLTLYRAAAERAGLKLGAEEKAAFPGAKLSHIGYADIIKIGNQFCCAVKRSMVQPIRRQRGSVGSPYFSDFLLTLTARCANCNSRGYRHVPRMHRPCRHASDRT